jgi:hypothetical protein
LAKKDVLERFIKERRDNNEELADRFWTREIEMQLDKKSQKETFETINFFLIRGMDSTDVLRLTLLQIISSTNDVNLLRDVLLTCACL